MQKREKGDDSLANNYIADSIFGAMDTIVKGAIRDLRYDQTIEAIVISTDKYEDGVYTVRSENASFEAYSSQRYYVNDTVYVMIPQGDFSKQKFITGRKMDQVSTESSFTLKLPFDDFIPLQNLTPEFNIKPLPTEPVGFIANHGNGSDAVEEHLKHGAIISNADIVAGKTEAYDEVNCIGHWKLANNQPVLTTKLAISLEVESYLQQYRPYMGRYGLRMLVTGMSKSTETESSREVTQEIYFTNDDMYGNTYAYLVPTVQQKIFDISDFISLSEIKLYFYQDFLFEDEQKTLIPWCYDEIVKDENGIEYIRQTAVPPNLFLSNIEVFLGLTVDDINEERVFLYTYDDIKYGHEPERTENRSTFDIREMHFAWVHHDYVNEAFVLVNTPEKLMQYEAQIFWYQMEYDVVAPEEEADELYWRLAPPNWKYMKNLLEDPNVTIPEDGSIPSGYYIQSEENNPFSIKVQPSIDKSKEKYMAIVYFGGKYEKSETLAFTNITDIDSMNEALAANKAFIFKFYRPATALDIQTLGENPEAYAYIAPDNPSLKLIEDNTIGNFFVYDENNKVLKNSDEIRFSDIEYYAIIHLLTKHDIDEDGEESEYYTSLYLDEESGFQSEITFPKNFSMFREVGLDSTDPYFGWYFKENGTEYDIAQENRVKTTVCKFRIDDFWNLNYNDNFLSAIITRNGRTYNINQEFLFGQSGSQGSEYTVRIKLESGSNYSLIKGQSFGLGAYVYDRNGRMLTPDDGSQMIIFEWELLGDSFVTPTATGSYDESNWKTVTFGNNFDSNGIQGYVRNDYPPIFRVTVTGAADYPISATRGFMMTNGNASLVQQYNIMCPDRVEYKSDGSAPIYDTAEFVVEHLNGDRIYPRWELIQRENGADVDNKYFFLEANEYPESRISTNYGTQTRVAYTAYRMVSQLGLNGNDRIAWYWEPEMADKCYLCLSVIMTEYNQEGNQGEVWVRQAIPLEHNVYASSLINSWDGSLTLDEENGAVLATMVSAGTKDNKNRFTGVMMGDWQSKADSSLDIPGLYGFVKGEQSFGFKTDGTGFIGKAGRGQIQFDGNNALISNASKDFYLNLDPITYNITPFGEFSLNEFNQYGYSPYFLYARTAKTADTWGNFADLNGTSVAEEGLISWTKPFFEDMESDYFIVDPNNGVLTTGGIVARYGKIGNWMISDNGLYQRYDPKTADDKGRYMYLGFPSTETTEELNALKVIYDAKYENAYIDYLDKLNALTVAYYPQIYEFEPIHYYNYGRDLKLAHDILIVTVDEYKRTGNGLQAILETKMAEMITNDFIDNFSHQHYYSNGQPFTDMASPKGNQTTGDRTRIYRLLGYKNTLSLFETYTVQYKYFREDGGIRTTGVYTRYLPISPMNYIRDPNAYSESTTSFITVGTNNPYHPDNTGTQRMYLFVDGKNSWLKEITLEQMEYLIDYWPQFYQNNVDGYLYQLEQQRKAGYTYVPYEERKALEDEYAAVKKEIDRQYAEAKREIHSRDDKRYAIFAGEKVDTDPVFYVRWNGDLFARRGLIANTWVIDEHSLTYRRPMIEDLTGEEKYNIIYLGTEKSEYNEDNYEPWGRVLKPKQETVDTANDANNDSRRWAFSAAEAVELEEDPDTKRMVATKPYEINFGIKLDGEIWAQKGTIAGWFIEKTQLVKYKDDDPGNPKDPDDGHYLIKLDSKRCEIAMAKTKDKDDKDAATILLHAGDGTTNDPPFAQIGLLGHTALITLAGYTIKSVTDGTVGIASNAITAGTMIAAPSVQMAMYNLWSNEAGSTPDEDFGDTLAGGQLNLQNNPTIAEAQLKTLAIDTPYYFAIEHPEEGPALRVFSTTNAGRKLVLEPNADIGVLGSKDNPWSIFGKEAFFSKDLYAQNVLVYDSIKGWYDSITKTTTADVSGYFPVATKEYVNYRCAELGRYTAALSKAVYDAFKNARWRINQIWKALGATYDENGNLIGSDQSLQNVMKNLKSAVIGISDATGTGSDGAIEIPVNYQTVGGAGSFKINFNIADTAFYRKNAVDKAYMVAVGGATSHIEILHPDESTGTYDTNVLSLNADSTQVVQTGSKGIVASLDVSHLKPATVAISVSCTRNVTSNGSYSVSVTAQAKNSSGTVLQTGYYYTSISVNVPTSSGSDSGDAGTTT